MALAAWGAAYGPALRVREVEAGGRYRLQRARAGGRPRPALHLVLACVWVEKEILAEAARWCSKLLQLSLHR